jgi:peptidoglycan/LPS O-acetylase OafA/YrhL
VECHFYLIWAGIIYLVKNQRHRLYICLSLVALAPLWRQLNIVLAAGAHINDWRSDLRYDSILVGCLLALLKNHKGINLILISKNICNQPVAIICSALIMWRYSKWFPNPPLSGSMSFILVAIIINFIIENHDCIFNKFLNALAWIGKLSYSIYLWQQLFAPDSGNVLWFKQFPQNILLLSLMSIFSFYYIEKPVLKLKDKLI